MRRLLAATVATGLLLSAAPSPATAATPRHCASHAEYLRVRTNGTQTPAKVQSIFGVVGKRIGWYSDLDSHGRRWWHYAYSYGPRCDGRPRPPVVWYKGTVGHPSVAVRKFWWQP